MSTDDGLGRPTEVPETGVRARIRRNPALRQAYRVSVFGAGLLCIALGIALAALPGPLTIPPVLLGLWIWSTEFAWAERLFDSFQQKGREAWEHAKANPKTSAAITGGGIVAAGFAFWAVAHFDLVDRAKDTLL